MSTRRHRHPRQARVFTLWCVALLLATPLTAQAQHDDDEEVNAPSPMYDFSDFSISGELSVTPGGAQDIAFFRDRVMAGEIPHPSVFTAEGLLSEHDLPLESAAPCHALICVTGQATDARLLVQPEVRYLAQLGFGSGLTAEGFRRDDLHIVAVVDKSGSMAGQLPLVQQSLRAVLRQLRPTDELSIVLYGDRSHIHLAPTPAKRGQEIEQAIDGIVSAGSTNMEEGLAVGFALAADHQMAFRGTTRVMLFTDERPNVGNTDAASFMGMAERASRAGIGMTTIGVGVQFGAELATKISSVRGGTLYFFPDAQQMTQRFEEDFDTMVTEMAWDVVLRIEPAPGTKVAGVYGIPGDLLAWGKDGSLQVGIATLFLSKRKGAIFVAYAPTGAEGLPRPVVPLGAPVGSVSLSYLQRDGKRVSGSASFVHVDRNAAGTGLRRGTLLVDQSTALKEAARLHHEANDQEKAYQLVHALASLHRQTADPSLAREREMVERLETTLAKLSGHQGEAPSGALDPISGLPRRR